MSDPTLDDRFIAAIRAIIRTELAALTYSGIYQYVVHSVSGSIPNVMVSAAPANTSLGLPALNNIAMAPSVLGGASMPAAGGTIYLAFADQDPTKPVFVAGDPTVQLASLDGHGMQPVAREGDTIVVTSGQTLAVTGTAGPYTITGAVATVGSLTGMITSGNPKVLA